VSERERIIIIMSRRWKTAARGGVAILLLPLDDGK